MIPWNESIPILRLISATTPRTLVVFEFGRLFRRDIDTCAMEPLVTHITLDHEDAIGVGCLTETPATTEGVDECDVVRLHQHTCGSFGACEELFECGDGRLVIDGVLETLFPLSGTLNLTRGRERQTTSAYVQLAQPCRIPTSDMHITSSTHRSILMVYSDAVL